MKKIPDPFDPISRNWRRIGIPLIHPFALLFTLVCIPGLSFAQTAIETAMIKTSFGTLPDGTTVDLYRLHNRHGMEVAITNLGATVVELLVPDKNGVRTDVVLGLKTPQEYMTVSPYFGCAVGRYGNRIARGRFSLNGTEYRLPINNEPNHLHGGTVGFDKAVWDATPFTDDEGVGIRFSHVSPDGDQGYPGTLKVLVTYRIPHDANELQIDYRAETDRPTVVNLTHHSYFNLDGHDQGTIVDHELMLVADRFTPVDSTLIPTGELRSVAGTPFDFRTAHRIGDRIATDDEQLQYGRGYDHNWVLNATDGDLALAARLASKKSGRVMEVWTTEPGIQFYTGNFLDGTITGKDNARYAHRAGLCLETQHFPDSPNHSTFPATTLLPTDAYRSRTVYRFVTP